MRDRRKHVMDMTVNKHQDNDKTERFSQRNVLQKVTKANLLLLLCTIQEM